jgi:NAD-dependent SIR2 family protein deacetylase
MTFGAFDKGNLHASLPFYGQMALNVIHRDASSFHHWMGQANKVIRNYSQNVDSIEEKVPGLVEKTELLHGTIKVNCSDVGF